MSKMDGLRAMREARYAAARAAAPAKKAERPPVAPRETPAGTAKKAPAKRAPAKAAAAAPSGSEELCGHRNMGGKTCTREQGHAAKSHRYS
ncbi:hypothetical protein [Nocardioides psychrotolerans]|uniref:hypothetical protein n=1 Tax=Nocardioides psychrotolerans TaxID=1005945 RepID=UPI0031383318